MRASGVPRIGRPLRGSKRPGSICSGIAAGLFCAAVLATGCFSEYVGGGTQPSLKPGSDSPAGAADFLEDVAPSASLEVDSGTPGESTGFTLFLFVPTGVREPQEAVIRAPGSFGFLGFNALGASALISTWDFDFANPGNGTFDGANFTIEHFAIDPNTAYSDSNANGVYDAATDPVVTHVQGLGGEHVFTLTMPNGADGDPNNNFSRFDTDVLFTMLDGILVNPAVPGSYDVEIEATSVDLDTGGASDGSGDAPLEFSQTVPVQVPEPAGELLAVAALACLGALRRLTHSQHR